MGTKKRVAIVGGGLVGLSTALHIAQRWPEVNIEVFEKENRVSALSGPIMYITEAFRTRW